MPIRYSAVPFVPLRFNVGNLAKNVDSPSIETRRPFHISQRWSGTGSRALEAAALHSYYDVHGAHCNSRPAAHPNAVLGHWRQAEAVGRGSKSLFVLAKASFMVRSHNYVRGKSEIYLVPMGNTCTYYPYSRAPVETCVFRSPDSSKLLFWRYRPIALCYIWTTSGLNPLIKPTRGPLFLSPGISVSHACTTWSVLRHTMWRS